LPHFLLVIRSHLGTNESIYGVKQELIGIISRFQGYHVNIVSCYAIKQRFLFIFNMIGS